MGDLTMVTIGETGEDSPTEVTMDKPEVTSLSDGPLSKQPKPNTAIRRRIMSDSSKPFIKELFHKEPCPYTHQVFHLAAIVFDALKHSYRNDSGYTARGRKDSRKEDKKVEIPNVEFKSENEKRLTFQLVFQTLKYQQFLADMLEDCKFFSQYPEFKDDHALVMVILCDFKQRKFQKRLPLPEDETNPYICQIEEALYETRTKLNAALARSRIKARVLSIDHLLPDTVRKNEKIGSNMHILGWVNFIKTSMESVLNQLRDEDFIEVQGEMKLSGKTYMLDNQCTDMIIFPYDQRDNIEQHVLVKEAHLVLQDKSSCVGPHSVRALINEGDDILHLNPGSGVTTAHLASLTHNSDTVIYTVGIHSEKQLLQITNNLERIGAKSRVKLLQENFLDIEYQDERLKHIKVVLLTAECSRSGVANPVNFIVSEGEDMSILRDLSLGYTDDGKLGELVVKHNTTLKHALRFPRVQAVVYCTRSLLDPENENVVTRSIEYVNMVQQKKTPFRIAPPVVPLSDRDIEMESPLNGKYLRYPPSNLMSGCFIATITREADDPKEAAKDILAKAAARGIISGVDVQRDDKPQKSKSKSGHKRNKTEKSARASSRRRSPPRSAVPREKKHGSPSSGRRTVSRKFYSSSRLSAGTRTRSGSTPGMNQVSHMHTKVFHSPFSNDVHSRNARNANSAMSWSRNSQRAPTPPHEKVIKHPMPFRQEMLTQ